MSQSFFLFFSYVFFIAHSLLVFQKKKSNFPICAFNDIKIVQFGLKYEEDMGFEITKGLELFFSKIMKRNIRVLFLFFFALSSL
jgi:hypothetical protein